MELTELKNKIIASFIGSADDLKSVITMMEEDQAVFSIQIRLKRVN